MKKSFDKGDTRSRKVHKDHDKVRWAYRKAQKNLEIERTEANLAAFKEARKVMLSTPHLDEMDENYKRLQYNRYADDFLISITGSKQDAENIKEQVKIFLKRQAKSHNVGGENSRYPIPLKRCGILDTT